ncbi:9668_t:CDS:10, partial [Scutellospora calospora]
GEKFCDIQDTPSAAINLVYQEVTGSQTKTKHSGLAVLGFYNEEIVSEMINDILFFPLYVEVDKFSILISKIEYSSQEDLLYAGPGYKSSLITRRGSEPYLISQQILEDHQYSLRDHYALFGLKDPQVQALLANNKGNVFWTCAVDPEADWQTLKNLYNWRLLQTQDFSYTNTDCQFWDSFCQALDTNKRGVKGKIRVLSIIVLDFSYQDLQNELGHTRLYGPSSPPIEMPKKKIQIMAEFKEKQFELFFLDKNNVTMSSYKIDPKTNLPILYFCNNKTELWKKFQQMFPNVMKKTSFMGRIADCTQLTYRDDLGGLCSICNEYRNSESEIEDAETNKKKRWPTEGPLAGFIRARGLPHAGPWKNFSPAEITKLTVPTNNKMTEIEGITNFNNGDDDRGSEMDVEDIPNLNEDNYQGGFETDVKANAKFGKKGGGKKIKKKVVNLLKQFFLNRNINAKDKLTAQEMHLELKKFAQSREIDDEDIPQVSTIHN